MEETNLQPAMELSAAINRLLEAYLRERVQTHPILSPLLRDATICATGSVPAGTWDERSDFDIRIIVSDEEHTRLGAALRDARLWDPARDFRLYLEDREPFRRFPGVQILILSASQLRQHFRYEQPIALWFWNHAVVYQDPSGVLKAVLERENKVFEDALDNHRCEHYYRFRQARNDLVPKIVPRRMTTVLAIKRGECVQEALRLAFLADGKPYPYDKSLEFTAERETTNGPNIVTAVRALLAARELETIEHASKVLRDRVAFALQQGGVSEKWLEQWWLWPTIAP